MARCVRSLLTALLAILLGLGLLAAPAAAGSVTRYVDDDGHAGRAGCDSDHRARRHIQRAVDLSGPTDVILVCPGVYREFVTIAGSGKNGLVIRSVKPGRAVLKPAPPVVAAIGPTGAIQPAGDTFLLSIVGARRVVIRSLRLSIPTAPPCALIHVALGVLAGSGGAVVRDVRIGATGADTLGDTNGCGYVTGIEVIAGGATVAHSSVRDFRNLGIVVQGGAASATLDTNTVRFDHAAEASTPGPCENGILVAEGARANVLANTIGSLDTAASSGGTPELCYGIFIDGAGSGTVLRANTVRYAAYGLELDNMSGGLLVARNDIRHSGTQGISLDPMHGAELRYNLVRTSGLEGIYVSSDSDGNDIHDNDFRNNDGVDCKDESTGGSPGAPSHGTANAWIADLGAESTPAGICSLP